MVVVHRIERVVGIIRPLLPVRKAGDAPLFMTCRPGILSLLFVPNQLEL